MQHTAVRGVVAEPPKDCALCPRLVAFRHVNAERRPDWYNGAVSSFGPDDAELLVVGLAPGLSGANRTGRPFTGDYAGDLLYATLIAFGFAEGRYAADPADGLRMKRAMITNAVRCVPPQNKPVGSEIGNCRAFLAGRIAALPRLRAILTLGRIAHDSTVRALGARPAAHPFGHAAESPIGAIRLFASYHCSRYNTNTGRLTPQMFEAVFRRIADYLGP